MSMSPRKLTSLTDAIDLYRNPNMATLRADRALWMTRHHPLMLKYHARVLEVAREHDKSAGALQKKLSKLVISFDDLVKE